MFAIRFYKAFILLAVFLVTAVGAASICGEDPSNPACNPNSLESHPDYEYVFFRSDNGTSSPDSEKGNKTNDGKGYPFYGNVGLVLNVPKLDFKIDFVLHFNGTVGNEAGDKIDVEMSSPMSNETLKFSLEYLALDKNGNVFRFIPADDTDSNSTTIAPTTTSESPKNAAFPEIGMICLKAP